MFRYPALFRPFLKTFKATRFFSDVVKTEGVLSKKEREEIPVHLRPYDQEKYEVPSTKLKVNKNFQKKIENEIKTGKGEMLRGARPW